MAATLQLESTLTDRDQTTVSDAVRRALKLGKRDKIRYLLKPDGTVVMERADDHAADDNPALGVFLEFLTRDIVAHPQRITALSVELLDRIRSITANVETDIDAAFPFEE